uniref:diguanylate cyclase domain-containing protein n=1 Tax=Segnochrobactrum spirostomi TaxID=2608987 RepID=UPI001297EBB6
MSERLLAAVTSRPVPVGEMEIPVGISVGGASRRSNDLRLADLFARADAALYAAKGQGRRRTLVAD